MYAKGKKKRKKRKSLCSIYRYYVMYVCEREREWKENQEIWEADFCPPFVCISFALRECICSSVYHRLPFLMKKILPTFYFTEVASSEKWPVWPCVSLCGRLKEMDGPILGAWMIGSRSVGRFFSPHRPSVRLEGKTRGHEFHIGKKGFST